MKKTTLHRIGITTISIILLTMCILPFVLNTTRKDQLAASYMEFKDSTKVNLPTSQDSLAALMSIIVEANNTLVRESCEYYILVKSKVPVYVKLSDEVNIKPSDDIFVWIPVDNNIYEKARPGDNLSTYPLVIGHSLYNGDLENIKLDIIEKQKRHQ